ncbi:MAG: type II toxin-antitoxin system prevent-host-death family antitoxin [Roseiflexaceae bacterium]|nr:type II toxin-antitoxin system prevent-host-death family antitoxin [Roseiflexaceae bacterium]
MTIQTTYTQARANFAELLDSVTDDREIIIIQRRGAADVALIAADELQSLLETAHLLRSPANAERLLTALARVQQRSGVAQTIDELRVEVGLGQIEKE